MEKDDKLVDLVDKFNIARSQKEESPEYLNALAEQIQLQNMLTYDINTPFIERRFKVSDFELQKWSRLEQYVKFPGKIKLFDAAFGSGRDLLIARDLGYDVFGCELSRYMFEDFANNNSWIGNKIVNCDIRNISFDNESFDIVRHNASFLHMPVIGMGYTIHKTLTESWRLLNKGGLLYIYTKEGNGFQAIDTGDGLGIRSFQLFTIDDISTILEECGFAILHVNRFTRQRNDSYINWIEIFSQKQEA